MGAWQTCQYCNKKLLGFSALGEHTAQEHPHQAAIADRNRRRDGLASAQADLAKYEQLLDLQNRPGLPALVYVLVYDALGHYPFKPNPLDKERGMTVAERLNLKVLSAQDYLAELDRDPQLA